MRSTQILVSVRRVRLVRLWIREAHRRGILGCQARPNLLSGINIDFANKLITVRPTPGYCMMRWIILTWSDGHWALRFLPCCRMVQVHAVWFPVLPWCRWVYYMLFCLLQQPSPPVLPFLYKFLALCQLRTNHTKSKIIQ